MPRLVAFGCSLTYGHGLPDCDEPETVPGQGREPGPRPSEMAWPSILAMRLGLPSLNLGVPGTSNFNILMKVLGHRWEEGDLAAILWSFPYRDTIYNADGEHDEIRGTLLHRDAVRKYYEVHTDFDMQTRQWVYQHHAALHLDSLGIKHAMASASEWDRCGWKGPDRRSLDSEEFLEDNWLDLGLDGLHPGVATHARWADSYHRCMQGIL